MPALFSWTILVLLYRVYSPTMNHLSGPQRTIASSSGIRTIHGEIIIAPGSETFSWALIMIAANSSSQQHGPCLESYGHTKKTKIPNQKEVNTTACIRDARSHTRLVMIHDKDWILFAEASCSARLLFSFALVFLHVPSEHCRAASNTVFPWQCVLDIAWNKTFSLILAFDVDIWLFARKKKKKHSEHTDRSSESDNQKSRFDVTVDAEISFWGSDIQLPSGYRLWPLIQEHLGFWDISASGSLLTAKIQMWPFAFLILISLLSESIYKSCRVWNLPTNSFLHGNGSRGFRGTIQTYIGSDRHRRRRMCVCRIRSTKS